MSKDFFYFNRQDRIASVVLLTVIVAIRIIRLNVPAAVDDAVCMQTDSLGLVWADSEHDTVRYKAVREQGMTYNYDRERQRYVKKSYSSPQQVRDTIFVPDYVVKERPSARIDLNAIDSAGLTCLPGIGPWTAQKIMRYRVELGGFVSIEQLDEIQGIADSLSQWFTVTDTIPVIRIRVNEASVSELRRHPYMNFYQARAIVELRRERGKVQGPGQLSLLEEFTEQDLERLLPYLDFE